MAEIIFGTERLKGKEGRNLLEYAWECGIRTFDTALAYDNQKLIGEFLGSLGDRRSCTVISKISLPAINEIGVEASFDKILFELKTDYLDGLLIHAPKNIDHEKVMTAMNELKAKGRVRKIGISNYTIKLLRTLLKLKPDMIQNEIHPFLQERHLVDFCNEQGIEVLAHSAFANGLVFTDLRFNAYARKIGLPVERIVMSWLLNRKISPIFSSLNKMHINNNSLGTIKVIDESLLQGMPLYNRDLRICQNTLWSEF